MGEIGQAEGWLVLAQVQSVMPQLHRSHVSRAHLLLNVVTWVAVTYGRVLASYCTNSLWNRLPNHIAAIYWLLLRSWLWTHWLEETAHHMHDELLMRQGSEKTISPQRHSPFFFSSHSAALSLFPFPSIPRGMEILTRTNFYCIGRQSASKWWKPVHDLS